MRGSLLEAVQALPERNYGRRVAELMSRARNDPPLAAQLRKRRPLRRKGWHQFKPVCGIDPLTGRIIRYECVVDAARAMGVSRSAIAEAIRSHHQSAGWYWWHADSDFQPSVPSAKCRPIKAIAAAGAVVVFRTVADAESGTGVTRRRIEVHCNSGRYVGGWRFYDLSPNGPPPWSYRRRENKRNPEQKAEVCNG